MSVISLVISGLLLVVLGGYWVHYLNKTHSLFKRMTAVFTTMLGCVFLWLSIAVSVPVIVSEKIEVIVTGQDWMIIRVEYDEIRSCKTNEFHAILIQGNERVELGTVYLYGGKTDSGSDFGFVVVMNSRYIVPSHFYLEINHSCPWGITVSTETPIMEVPPEFNIIQDDGYTI